MFGPHTGRLFFFLKSGSIKVSSDGTDNSGAYPFIIKSGYNLNRSNVWWHRGSRNRPYNSRYSRTSLLYGF